MFLAERDTAPLLGVNHKSVSLVSLLLCILLRLHLFIYCLFICLMIEDDDVSGRARYSSPVGSKP